MPRILYCVLLCFASAFAAQPARAQDKVEGTRTGLDYVHASLAIGADLPSFSAKYDLDVTRRPGDWDRVLFEGNRSGTGGLLSAAFGFRLIPQLAAGAQVEFARATASLDHALLEETGVRFAPRLDRMFASLFADARGRGPWHGGLGGVPSSPPCCEPRSCGCEARPRRSAPRKASAFLRCSLLGRASRSRFLALATGRNLGHPLALGYVFLRERMLSPSRHEYDHGLFGVQLFGGYLIAVGHEVALDTTLRTLLAFERASGGARGQASSLNAFAACVGLRFR